MGDLRYEKLTYALRGAIFEIHSQLKVGWPEEAYHRALAQLLESRSIPIQFKPRRTLTHRGFDIHTFECDLIAYDQIILELKVLPYAHFAPVHYAQLIHYLKCWGKDLGLLANFGPMRVEIERRIWDEPTLPALEVYELIKDYYLQSDNHPLDLVRQIILNIHDHYGLGYPETVYRKIAEIDLNHAGLKCESHQKVSLKLSADIAHEFITDYFLIAETYLLNIRALLSYPTKYDFAQMKTYLNQLGVKVGLIANFGKQQLQIFGVTAD